MVAPAPLLLQQAFHCSFAFKSKLRALLQSSGLYTDNQNVNFYLLNILFSGSYLDRPIFKVVSTYLIFINTSENDGEVCLLTSFLSVQDINITSID